MIYCAILLFNAYSIFDMSVSVPPGTSYGVQQASSSWSTVPPNGQQEIKGIHQGSIVSMRLLAGPLKGVPVILWNDGKGFGGRAGGGPREGGYFDGEQTLPNGKNLVVQARTKNGKSGHVTIGTTKYDLDDGALFLISTQTAKPRVLQLKIDPDKVPVGDVQQLIAFASSNRQVKQFWAPAAAGNR